MLDFQNIVYLIVILLFLSMTVYRICCYIINRKDKVAELQYQITKYKISIEFEQKLSKYNKQVLSRLIDNIQTLLSIIGYEKYGHKIDTVFSVLRTDLHFASSVNGRSLLTNDQAAFIKTFPEVVPFILSSILEKDYLTNGVLDFERLINHAIKHISSIIDMPLYLSHSQNIERIIERNKYA
ncbi:MAG: hypothetical protein O2809_10125 [Proteobacteria bacterium]|nr:hypothetical protein [Pseudomonadota bacterium]